MFWNYDGDWATRKVKLGYTPHFASYDIEQKVVTVACSREEKIEMLPKITAEGNKEYEAMPDIPNIGKPTSNLTMCKLFLRISIISSIFCGNV